MATLAEQAAAKQQSKEQAAARRAARHEQPAVPAKPEPAKAPTARFTLTLSGFAAEGRSKGGRNKYQVTTRDGVTVIVYLPDEIAGAISELGGALVGR